MGNLRDVIRKEVATKSFATEGQQDLSLVKLDESRGNKIYSKGPPEMIYCKLADGSPIRVALISTGTYSNEVKTNPRGFRVRLAGPARRLPRSDDVPVAYGELVRAIPEKPEADISPTRPSPLLGQRTSSSVAKSVEVGNTSIKVGESGDVEVKCDGEVVRSFAKDVEIKRKPENSTVMFGGDRKTIFKENFLGQILPKAFLPPMNTPNWTPDLSILERSAELLGEAARLMVSIQVDL